MKINYYYKITRFFINVILKRCICMVSAIQGAMKMAAVSFVKRDLFIVFKDYCNICIDSCVAQRMTSNFLPINILTPKILLINFKRSNGPS